MLPSACFGQKIVIELIIDNHYKRFTLKSEVSALPAGCYGGANPCEGVPALNLFKIPRIERNLGIRYFYFNVFFRQNVGLKLISYPVTIPGSATVVLLQMSGEWFKHTK